MKEASELKRIRESRGMTLAEASELIGTTADQLSKLERGERGLTVSWLNRILEAYEMPTVEFYGDFSEDSDGAAHGHQAQGNDLKRLREKAGYTQQAAGDLFGVDNTYINRLENGRIGLGQQWIERFCDAYDASPNDIFTHLVSSDHKGGGVCLPHDPLPLILREQERLGWGDTELGRRADISRDVLRKWRAGKVRDTAYSNVIKIFEALGITSTFSAFHGDEDIEACLTAYELCNDKERAIKVGREAVEVARASGGEVTQQLIKHLLQKD